MKTTFLTILLFVTAACGTATTTQVKDVEPVEQAVQQPVAVVADSNTVANPNVAQDANQAVSPYAGTWSCTSSTLKDSFSTYVVEISGTVDAKGIGSLVLTINDVGHATTQRNAALNDTIDSSFEMGMYMTDGDAFDIAMDSNESLQVSFDNGTSIIILDNCRMPAQE